MQGLSRRLILAAFAITSLFLLNFRWFSFRRQHVSEWHYHNRTLGFEKIVAISSGKSWRVDGLLEAAEFTGIDIEVPKQPRWSDEEVDAFRGLGIKSRASEIGPGQARCWLGHLNALREIVVHQWATALILEDDVDWDVAIKEQITLLTPLIRQITNSSEADSRRSPYGDSWDLLWLGHCGETTPSSGVLSVMDYTLPESALYRQVYGQYIYRSPQLRTIQRPVWPICPFAYAVTAEAALKIYGLASGGMDRIITMDLRDWCRSGVLRCASVNPELFHHHKEAGQRSSEIAKVEGWEDQSAPETVSFTANIRYSARCNARSETLVSCQEEKSA